MSNYVSERVSMKVENDLLRNGWPGAINSPGASDKAGREGRKRILGFSLRVSQFNTTRVSKFNTSYVQRLNGETLKHERRSISSST